MESFIIEGGHPLTGTIIPQGAKNEALEVICTTILTDEPVRIKNVPDILDVNNLIKLLREIGVKVTQNSRNDYTFQSDELKLDYLDSLEFVAKCSSLRGSVLMIGPLLGRCVFSRYQASASVWTVSLSAAISLASLVMN